MFNTLSLSLSGRRRWRGPHPPRKALDFGHHRHQRDPLVETVSATAFHSSASSHSLLLARHPILEKPSASTSESPPQRRSPASRRSQRWEGGGAVQDLCPQPRQPPLLRECRASQRRRSCSGARADPFGPAFEARPSLRSPAWQATSALPPLRRCSSLHARPHQRAQNRHKPQAVARRTTPLQRLAQMTGRTAALVRARSPRSRRRSHALSVPRSILPPVAEPACSARGAQSLTTDAPHDSGFGFKLRHAPG